MSDAAASTVRDTTLTPPWLVRALRTRERQFWFLQTTGWATYFIAAYLGALAYEKPTSFTMVILGATVGGFLLSTLARYIYHRLWARSPVVLFLGVVSVSWVLALVWTFARNQIYWNLYKPYYEPDRLIAYFSGGSGGTYLFLCWSGLYFGIKYYRMLQTQQEQTLRANAMAHEAQLKMLRYQLNPHFLFNTLNAISTLILDGSNEAANRTVARLSDFLRYTLHNDPMQKVTLEQELKSLNLYLEIEKVRFQDRLNVEIDVDETARQALIPSLLTQPLIENSIKYAIAPSEDGGTISVAGHVVQNRLVLELADDGPGLDEHNGEKSETGGVGLRNTRERLHQVYGSDYSLELTRARPTGLRIIIAVPYQPDKPAP